MTDCEHTNTLHYHTEYSRMRGNNYDLVTYTTEAICDCGFSNTYKETKRENYRDGYTDLDEVVTTSPSRFGT